MKRRRVAVLGATGAVGQAFIRLLADHPFALDLVHGSARVDNPPASRQQLHRQIGAILDPDVIGPEPPVEGRVGLLGEIADGAGSVLRAHEASHELASRAQGSYQGLRLVEPFA